MHNSLQIETHDMGRKVEKTFRSRKGPFFSIGATFSSLSTRCIRIPVKMHPYFHDEILLKISLQSIFLVKKLFFLDGDIPIGVRIFARLNTNVITKISLISAICRNTTRMCLFDD